ncbi:A/G-specific adenine glycosylase [Acidocella aquatica]|uniref:Adenine DNA glycosylase n=1 Tax=Acidocella aquatica TaxID=1922313 RepID=A0ABQ6ABF9_9PROT|nr:A/G-specific adenine glycosylase [Acidocella aquatica]GLR68760.1 A/G-specific adenine glycosylase [Acidocella aquatica]
MKPASYAPPPAKKLLSWYAAHRRHLPWRSAPGAPADPYHVWLSEIMLQQTVVATVAPYYAKFLAAYPTVESLSAAPVESVLGMWAGLGYYARARNLHACARAVAGLGGFPRSIEGLRALPGIGPYTANAIAAIAFSLPALPVDGNIERVAARIFAIATPLPGGKKAIATAAECFMEDKAARAAPGDFAQALFDLGATICAPQSPGCGRCPWERHCAARAQGIAAALPVRGPKPARPHRTGTAYVLLDAQGDVLLLRRPPKGLLGGMLVLPEEPPVAARWRDAGAVEHVFTHFSLTLSVLAARRKTLPGGALRAPAATAPLPSVMRKALDAGRLALDDAP